jgi:hypothetical protein
VTARLDLSRTQILAYRRTIGSLDERLAAGLDSLRDAAWAGLQDSTPRAALLSIHARVEETRPDAWAAPSLVQLWGPRYNAYVVAKRDIAVFTLGRLPDDEKSRSFAFDMAARLDEFLAGRTMTYAEAGRAMGVHPGALRYGAPTGRILIRWEGARQPTVWTVPPPDVDPAEARLELARRHLHVLGPTTPAAFAEWAGIPPARARAAYGALGPSLIGVRTPIGDAWILATDEQAFRAPAKSPAPARLLPGGDAYFLLQGADREVLVPEADRRSLLWTSRVWPGAVLVAGEIVGTWRRSAGKITIETWRRLSRAERGAVELEAASLPLPDVRGRIVVRWAD